MSDACVASTYNPDKSDRTTIECEIILYITVMGGGCSGYIYELDLEENPPSENHQIITQDGISVAVQNADSSMLNGLMLDYEDRLMGGGFKMTNPNANRTCGCGLSFG